MLWEVAIIDQIGEQKFAEYLKYSLGDFDHEKYSICKSDLLNEENKLLKDTLTLSFNISLKNPQNLKIQESKAIEDVEFHEIYKQRKFADFTFKFEDKLIKKHRVLLASRNRLLKDRLEKFPKSSNVLELQDVGLDFEVAEQVIGFLYDEKVEDMERYAKPLLAAIKLEMRHLELCCLEYFFGKLCLANALETLKLSDGLKIDKLKFECIKLINK